MNRDFGAGIKSGLVCMALSLLHAFLIKPSFADDLPKVAAFILANGSDDSAAKAVEQGMKLAIEKQSPAVFSLQVMNVAQGAATDSPALMSAIEGGHTPVVFYWDTESVRAVAPVIAQSEVLGLVAWDVTEKVIPLGRQIFGFGFSIELTFKELAKFAGKVLKSYRFGLISTSAVRFDTQSREFSEETKSLGNTVVFDEKVEATAADFSALITRALKEKCDTIFAALPAATLVSFIKAARAAGYKGKIITGDTLYAPEIALLAKDAEGIYLMQTWSDDADFKALYTSKYQQTPDNVTLGAAALGYDAINCLQEAGVPYDASTIRYSLLSKPCEGLTGTTQFTGERMAKRRKRVLTVKNGQFALAE